MHFTSKKASLIILGLTAIASSRTMFMSFNDPEGPNLLIIMVLAMVLYFASVFVCSFIPSITGLKRILLAIAIQIIIVVGLYFLGK